MTGQSEGFSLEYIRDELQSLLVITEAQGHTFLTYLLTIAIQATASPQSAAGEDLRDEAADV